MRVSKNQIINGVAGYIQDEILPKMQGGKAMQIVLSILTNAAAANGRLLEDLFNNSMVKALLQDDGSGMYDVAGIVSQMVAALDQYGSFPLVIPAIPIISPHEITLELDAEDVAAMRRRIEGME